MRPLVVLPTYQEAANIATVLRRLRAVMPAARLLVVDDGSPDGTAAMAEAVGAELGGIDVLRRTAKDGLGRAYLAGFAWGLERGFDVIVEMDADLQHDPSALPRLVAPVVSGTADLSVGSRYVPGGSIPKWPLPRRLLSRWGNRYAAAVLGLPLADSTSGFRAYRAEMLKTLALGHIRSGGYAFQIETAYRVARAGGQITEVPIEFVDRSRGSSKMSGRIVVEALVLVTLWGVRDRLRARRDRRRETASA